MLGTLKPTLVILRCSFLWLTFRNENHSDVSFVILVCIIKAIDRFRGVEAIIIGVLRGRAVINGIRFAHTCSIRNGPVGNTISRDTTSIACIVWTVFLRVGRAGHIVVGAAIL